MRLHAIVADEATGRRAVRGGASVVQLRLKGAATDDVVERGGALRELCAESGVTFVVNDDVEAALRLRADGVHLGREDDGADRAFAAGLVVGLSARTVEEAREAEALGATYVGVGPVWATPSKDDAGAPVGIDGLAAACVAVATPVVAIGGVTAQNAGDCLRAGASGVAAIREVAEIDALKAALDATG